MSRLKQRMMNILSYQRNTQREVSVSSYSTGGRLRQALLALLLLTTGVGSAWADTWDGTITNNADNKFAENGITLQTPGEPNSEDNPYTIDNAKEFAYFMRIVHEKWTGYSSTYYWKLTADIDLNNIAWTHGSNSGNSFQGHFDGGGYTISSLSLTVNANSNFGLFTTIQGESASKPAEVKNLNINGVTFTSSASRANTTRLGALTGYVKQANISNITISNVTFTYTGGITNENDLGGAIGYTDAATTVSNVTVSGVTATFTGTTTNLYVAGLIGKINNQTEVTNCSASTVSITYNTIANASRISGLIGSAQGGSATAQTIITNCSVSGTSIDLKAGINNGSYIGALLAQGGKSTVLGDGTDENKNTVSSPIINIAGDIKAVSYIGGAIGDFAGAASNTSEVKKLTVTSPSITVNNYTAANSLTGGVFGRVSTFATVDGVSLTGTTLSFTKPLSVAQQIGTFAGTIVGNATQQVAVNNVTIDASTLTFGSTNSSNTVNIRTGVIGQITSNVLLDTWTVSGNSTITVNGNLATTGSRIGGFVGSIEPGDATDSKVIIRNVAMNGTSSINVTGNITASSNLGGFVGYAIGRSKNNTSVTAENISLATSNITVTGQIKAASYIGGLAGYLSTAIKLRKCNITTAANITVNGEINSAGSYIGGAIAYIQGASGYPSVIEELGSGLKDGMSITTPTVTIDKINIKDCYVGSVFGRVNTFTTISDLSIASPTVTYKNTGNPNVALNIGTIAGGFAGSTAQQVAVTNVDITGTAQLTLGTDANKATTEVKNVKAGLIGQATTNVRLEDWTVEKTNVQVYGKLTTAASQIGAFADNLTGTADAPTTVKNIKINKDGVEPGSNLNVTGDVKVACNLGGFAGIATTNIRLEGCEVTKPTVTIGGDLNTATSYVGGVIGYIKGGAGNTSFIEGLTVTNPQVDIAKVSSTQRVGAVFGSIDSYDNMNNITVSSPKLNYTAVSNPNVDLYLGTFSGYLNGVKEQETLLTNINITGTAELTIGTEANKGTINVSKVRAGLLGYTKTNIRLEDWIIANSNVQVYGSLTTTADYFGGFAGSMESDNNTPLTLKNVKVTGNSTVNVTGNIGIGSYLGGFAGAIGQGNITYSNIVIDDAGVTGTATVNVGGNVTAASYFGGFTGYLYGKAANGNNVKADNVVGGTINLTITGQTTAGSYYGGLAGRVNTMCKLNDWKVTTAANLTLNNNITALSYVGGAIGSLEGAAGYPSSATGFDVKGLDINLNGNLTNGLYVGGIAGQLNAVAQANKIEKSSASGKIHTTDNHTFVRNKTYAFGGIVGYTAQSSTTFSEVNNCVSEVDFNLSGYTPSEVSGDKYNMQQNGFVIGGVIGRINTPYRLPEYLYYSGKIYAPFAMVSPIVGVFLQNIGDAKYAYNDYSGENVNAAVVPEMDVKEQNWYFNGYQIGLSTAVSSQALNTTASPSTVDDVSYLTIGENTLTKSNSISGATKHSKTILAYTASGSGGINPAWNTGGVTYPAYYMYYMQGVNRGIFIADDQVETIKAQILSGALALLTLTDANANLTIATNRGIISHAFTATASGADRYKWYVDGVAQSETSANFSFTPAMKGNTIAVEAIKDGKAIKRVDCKVMSVLRVSDASAAVGTKTNPYLIGSAEELQLLSFLSTLPLNTPWENTYTSDGHYNKAYYELDADINLNGIADFTPISFATGFKANNVMNPGYVFDGVLDGKQYKISGLKEEWYGGIINGNDSYAGWGLFSVVGSPVPTVKVGDSEASPAAIRNLIIDGAALKHKTDNVTFNYNDNTADVKTSNNVCIGVLAGLVLNNTKIENIEIRNSKITDEGSNDYSLATRGLYVGGAVGSIQNSFNDQANAPANTKLQHVAAQVDITLEHPTFVDPTAVGQIGLFNIGGIIGRYCATAGVQSFAQASMPKYTFYSGKVNAPKAWISPVVAAVRYADQQGNSWTNFSKQWEGNNNSAATQLTITNAQYYNYYIGETLITGLTPSDKCDRGSRTIKWHVDATDDADSYNAEKYQGVNYDARFIDSNVSSLKFLNESPVDGVYWVWENGFVHMSNQAVYSFLDRTDNVFTANMSEGEPSAYRWEISMDGETWLPVTGETQIYTPAASSTPKLIIAIVTAGGNEYRTQPELVTPSDSQFGPAIQYSVDGDNYTFTINWNGLEPEGTVSATYQWYHADKTTPFEGQTTDHLTISKSNFESVAVGGSVWCKVTITELEKELAQFMVQNSPLDATVIYVKGNGGNDSNDGLTPETAVKTINVANGKLTGGSWDKNYIVVIGTLNNDGYFRSSGKKPATITGRWNGHDYEGVINIKQKLPASGEHYVNNVAANEADGTNCYVLGDTKFEYLTFSGYKEGNSFIELHGCDVVFGKGLVMQNFNNLSTNHGNMGNSEKIPEFTILLTATNLPESQIQKYTTERTKPQVVTFQSGHYGRLMGGRFTQNFFPGGSGGQADNTAYSILGSAANPVWAVINIEIADDNEPTDGKGSRYSRDINAVIAGLTDGSMYGDIQINFHGGDVAYIVGGNQGNAVKNGTQTYTPVGGTSGSYGQWPNASYFGRTVINVEQKDGCKAIAIGNLYAGGLGRMIQTDKASAAVDMYVYGRTEVNVKSGTISGSVYGGGVGGVIGVNPWDAHAPYKATGVANNATTAIQNGVQYGDNRVTGGAWSGMTKDSPMAQVVLHNLNADGKTYDIENLDLRNSSTTVNVSGGTVNGNVYGGGYGFVQDMPLYAAMQGIGSVFGTANINITGGTILGNVFGGSQGSSFYYGGKNQYDQTINHIAEMNGTVNLTISGTEEKCPVIKGDIYGAGEGIKSSGDEEYLRIATAGNTELGTTDAEKEQYKTNINLTIDIPDSKVIEGNVFGGGKMGAVDGNINVVIKGGQINGNVYGGGKGEKDHLNKARVNGTTKVTLGEK